MNVEKDSKKKLVAAIFKAIGHTARLEMIMALADGEMCVCELQKLVGSDMSTVSKHLTVLKSVGLVDDDKRGKQVFYSLKMPCVIGFIDCIVQGSKEV